jgi:hypothetical protein
MWAIRAAPIAQIGWPARTRRLYQAAADVAAALVH